MPKRHPPYPEEFRQQLISLQSSGQSISDFADEFQACYQTVRRWIKQAEFDEGKRDDGLTTKKRVARASEEKPKAEAVT